MHLGRYLITNFTAADGYKVTAPEEVRVAEISTTQLFVRVIWDHAKNDQSWESLPELTKCILEQLDSGRPQLPYPSITTMQPVLNHFPTMP